jgi:deoxyadenosine/deoxycytidine kinase
MRTKNKPLIGVVGPCAAGKTTLIAGLLKFDFKAQHIAQEHSYVQDMWQRLTNPSILIFLDASFPETIKRRNLEWLFEEYKEQHRRLNHSRQNCDLYIFTDPLTSCEVIQNVLTFLKEHHIEPNILPYSS